MYKAVWIINYNNPCGSVFKIFLFSTNLHCIQVDFSMDDLPWKANRELHENISPVDRADLKSHRDVTLLLRKGYHRELSTRLGRAREILVARARHAGTVLNSREARSRACARLYGTLSRKSLTAWGSRLARPRKCGTTSTTRSPPRDLCHEAVFTLLVNVGELRIVSRHAPDV